MTLETGVSQGIATQERGVTPEIQVEAEGSYSKPNPPSSLLLTQKLSHSSSDINFEGESQQVRIVCTNARIREEYVIENNYDLHRHLMEKKVSCRRNVTLKSIN